MSISEKEIEHKIELPAKEDVERAAYCVGTYLSAFSKEPFDEKWSINGEKSSGFLLNPKTTGEFVNEVLNQENLELLSLSDGGEQVKVGKEIVLKHIEETLKDPMTEYLFSEGCISEADILELEEFKYKIETMEDAFVKLHMPYPLTSVINSYLEAIKDPESFVLLGYQNKISPESNKNVQFLRLQTETKLPENLYPRLIARYLTVNSPKSGEPVQNATEVVLNEINYYLAEEEIEGVKEFIKPNLYTIFLGEIAKIGTFSKNFRANLLTGSEYLKVLISDAEEIMEKDKSLLIPEQIVYFTLSGTTIAEREGENPSESKFFNMIKGLSDGFGVEHEEKIKEFPRSGNQKMFLTNIRKL